VTAEALSGERQEFPEGSLAEVLHTPHFSLLARGVNVP
jgi:hypothetical protein